MKNRERLVRAAAELFTEQGYAATSVEDLLQATGVARSNFYYHFDGKLGLAREVMSRWSRSYHEALDEAWSEVDEPADRVRKMFRLLQDGDGEGELLRCRIGAMALELAPYDEEIREELDAFLERLRERFEVAFRDGVEEGEFVENVGKAPAPEQGMRVLLGGLMLCHASPDCSSMDRVERDFLRVVGRPEANGDGAEAERPAGRDAAAGAGDLTPTVAGAEV